MNSDVQFGVATCNFECSVNARKNCFKIYKQRLERLYKFLINLVSKHNVKIINLQELSNRFVRAEIVRDRILERLQAVDPSWRCTDLAPRQPETDKLCLYLITFYNSSVFELTASKNLPLNVESYDVVSSNMGIGMEPQFVNALVSEFLLKGHRYVNCCVHQSYRDDSKLAMLERLFQYLERYDSSYFVTINGDFNIAAGLPSFEQSIELMSSRYDLNAHNENGQYYYENYDKSIRCSSSYIGLSGNSDIRAMFKAAVDSEEKTKLQEIWYSVSSPDRHTTFGRQFQPIDWFLSSRNSTHFSVDSQFVVPWFDYATFDIDPIDKFDDLVDWFTDHLSLVTMLSISE